MVGVDLEIALAGQLEVEAAVAASPGMPARPAAMAAPSDLPPIGEIRFEDVEVAADVPEGAFEPPSPSEDGSGSGGGCI